MTPPNGFKGPHWVRYRHHTENPMHVTEVPVSTRPRAGMPSRVSWPVMGRPTAHLTGVTLASGDLPSNLNAHEGGFGCHLPWEEAPRLVLLEGRERYRVLVGAVSAGGLSKPDSGTQSALLPRIKSSEEVVCPAAGEVAENMGLPPGSLGRGGEREREEVVER